MYYLVYKTVNRINNNYYIGCHITENIDDGYLGSGDILSQAVAKYGRGSFEREILFFAKDEQEMLSKEKQLVVVRDLDPNSYNLIEGGGKPPVHSGENHHNVKNPPNGDKNSMWGRRHSLETKMKMANSNRGKSHCKWITNGIDSRYVLKSEEIPDGWALGRTINREVLIRPKDKFGKFVKGKQ